MNEFLAFALKSMYLMLPAYFANMAPVIVKKINLFSYPVDFNRKLGKMPIFGAHKTFRGFFFGAVSAITAAYLQFMLSGAEFFGNISVLDYGRWLLLGILMGFGALFGDLVKSFFKRRIGIAPGHKFIPFDQIDFVFGALIFTMIAFRLSWQIFIAALILSFLLHIMVNHLAYWLKIRNEAW